MGAIDLVVQIEAPPSVASGLQRIGRAGHQVGATSEGLIFPKYRGDLVACAAAARSMHEGLVEATRYPRNPLDVLAQQIVATVAMDRWPVDELFALVRRRRAVRRPRSRRLRRRPRHARRPLPLRRVRRAAAAHHLGSRAPHGGRRAKAPSASPSPTAAPSPIAGSTACSSPARRAGAAPRRRARRGDGVREPRRRDLPARRLDLAHRGHHPRQVIVSPAPGEPGKMPFWKGEAAGRPLEFGRAIGALVRSLQAQPAAAALARLEKEHDLDRQAAENLLQYLGRSEGARSATCPTIAPSSSSAAATSSATGASACCRRSAAGCMAPWSMAILAEHARGERHRRRDDVDRRRPRRALPRHRRAARSRG